MGTWNTSINGNDTFLDIYNAFFDRYNSGESPKEISETIVEDYSSEFEDTDDKNNALFALALAQWETKSLDPEIYVKVKTIIETGGDLEAWKGLRADTKTLKKRKAVLDKFLAQLTTEREKPKRRARPKFEFEKVVLVKAIAPDNKKTFEVGEEIVNKNYVHTGGLLMWAEGGGSVLYFNGQNKNISAYWIDDNTLEVTHDNDIVFNKKDDRAYFCGDEVKIIYKTETNAANIS
jgi:hypothetical protein